MFGKSKPFGKAKSVDDPTLGVLTLTKRAWRGSLRLDSRGSIPLSVPGARSGPDEAALALAGRIPVEYERCRAEIAAALEEHRDAALHDHEELPVDSRPMSAAVVHLDQQPTIQLAYQVDWDDDHILGACLRDGQLVELNGSILEP